jgi:hypothetical protein
MMEFILTPRPRLAMWTSGWMAALSAISALTGSWSAAALFLSISILAFYSAKC